MQTEQQQQPEPAIKSHSNVPALVIALGIVLIIAAVNFLAPTGWTKVRAEQNAKFEATPAPTIITAETAPTAEVPAVPSESPTVTEVRPEDAEPVEQPKPKITLTMGKLIADAEGKLVFEATEKIDTQYPLAVKVALTELPDDTKAIGARVNFPAEIRPTVKINTDEAFAKIKPGAMQIAWMKGYEDKVVEIVYEFDTAAADMSKPLEFKAGLEWRGDRNNEMFATKKADMIALTIAPTNPASESAEVESLASAK